VAVAVREDDDVARAESHRLADVAPLRVDEPPEARAARHDVVRDQVLRAGHDARHERARVVGLRRPRRRRVEHVEDGAGEPHRLQDVGQRVGAHEFRCPGQETWMRSHPLERSAIVG
jgi:hypothetical protein